MQSYTSTEFDAEISTSYVWAKDAAGNVSSKSISVAKANQTWTMNIKVKHIIIKYRNNNNKWYRIRNKIAGVGSGTITVSGGTEATGRGAYCNTLSEYIE